jgi:outer membrane biosynthesis protein TonB
MSAWATIVDSNGTTVASYTSPVLVGSGTISFTLTYDIPEAEQTVHWPAGQPWPSGPVVLTFVGTLYTHSDNIDGTFIDGQDQYTFAIYPMVIATVSATPRPTPRPTDAPTPRSTDTPTTEPNTTDTPPPTASSTPESTDTPTPEPTTTDTPSPTASPTLPSPSVIASGSVAPVMVVAAAASTGNGPEGWVYEWLVLLLVALIGVALSLCVHLYRQRSARRRAAMTHPEPTQVSNPTQILWR